MKLKKNRTIRLTNVALIPVLVALGGCSWLQENPKSGAYNNWQSAETVAPPPQTRVMQTAEGTWLEPDRTPKPVPTATELAELKQANQRIAELEQEIGGDAALLVDPFSVDSIAEAMHRVTLGDPVLRELLRDRGLARSRTFSWERTARETLAVYGQA